MTLKCKWLICYLNVLQVLIPKWLGITALMSRAVKEYVGPARYAKPGKSIWSYPEGLLQ